MAVSRLQPIDDEDQKYATQRDPAPEHAHLKLSPNNTHSSRLAPNQNIARVSIQHQPDLGAGLCRVLKQNPLEQRHRLHHAKGYASRKPAGD